MIYRFSGFELDLEARELRRDGATVELQPKPFELLCLLIRERARIVPVEELMSALWPDVAVTPSSLTRAVSHARRAIGDTHRGALIRSHARRGYRFHAEVGAEEKGEKGAQPDEPIPFVGREDALAELGAALAAAEAGTPRLAVVNGPPGIGKTRLVEAFAPVALARGARVLVGRCRDREGAPAFWVWGQLLRGLAAEGRDTPALRELGRRARELAPAASQEHARTPDQSRFLFFEAVSEALREAARERPLVIVLEDLQWSAQESLRLLEHVVFEHEDGALLVIATVRDEPRARGHAVDRTLAALRGLERCRSVALRPLSRREVGELLERVVGRRVPADLTSELASRTEGVPLFLREALRALEARGELRHLERLVAEPLPLSAHALELVRRSLDALAPRCAALLEAAAVLGREFPLPLAAEVAVIPRAEATELLDGAVRAGVVEPVPQSPASYRFAHALHREAVYDAIAPGRRAGLHLRVAERLEQRGGEPDALASELAHHHYEALAVGDPERAYAFALRAAERASARLAWEDAALHWRRALAALDCLPVADAERRLETLLRSGEAEALAGDPPRRRSALREAASLARSLRRPEALVRAAIGYCDLAEWGARDPDAEPLLLAALEVDPGAASPARAQLLTRLAYRSVRQEPERAQQLGREALALARRVGDPTTLQEAAYVLHFALAGPDHLDDRAAAARGDRARLARCAAPRHRPDHAPRSRERRLDAGRRAGRARAARGSALPRGRRSASGPALAPRHLRRGRGAARGPFPGRRARDGRCARARPARAPSLCAGLLRHPAAGARARARRPAPGDRALRADRGARGSRRHAYSLGARAGRAGARGAGRRARARARSGAASPIRACRGYRATSAGRARSSRSRTCAPTSATPSARPS